MTTAAITDLSQEKLLYHMIYSGMTGGSLSFTLLKSSAGVFCFFFFLFCCAVCWDWAFEKRRRWRILPFLLTEANINSAWQSILPKRKRHQASFRERCHRMEMIVASFHKLCLEWFITFYHLKCLHFIDLLRIVMFTPFICHTVLMYEQFCCIRPHWTEAI